jgi:selenium metabolism protein YedF
MTCPIPVVETKNFLQKKEVDEIEIILDNDMATENVGRFLTTQGFTVVSEREKDGSRSILVGKRLEPDKNRVSNVETGGQTGKLLVYINTETIGVGSDELGRLLMNSFLHTLKDLDKLPWRIIFINGGVKLVADDSEHVGILSDIASLGTEVLSCGTCLDYFHLKDRVRVGRISNMHEIASSFLQASHVIRP